MRPATGPTTGSWAPLGIVPLMQILTFAPCKSGDQDDLEDDVGDYIDENETEDQDLDKLCLD